MCMSVVMSSVCPGPKPGRGTDTRCRGCKKIAGQFSPMTLDPTKSVLWAQKRADLGTEFARANARKDGLALGEGWSHFAERFLIDVFEEACNSQPPGRFSLAVAGSLARLQATPFSDVEYFFVVDDAKCVVPFSQIASTMWRSLGVINKATGSFAEDLFFAENSRYNVLTTAAECLFFDDNAKRPKYDAGLDDMLEAFSFGDASYEQLSGARCIAGDAAMLERLKFSLRNHKGMSPIYELRDRLRTNVIPELQQFKRGLELGNHSINIKAVIQRTILWITIGLGRYYNLHGVGDVAQLTQLLARRKISKVVFKQMVDAMNYAQAARFQTHMSNRAEADEVALTPELKTCLRTVSALVEMCDVWLKQKAGKAAGHDKKRDCFRTSHPERYDFFKLAGWTA
jgi:hypothetical protein